MICFSRFQFEKIFEKKAKEQANDPMHGVLNRCRVDAKKKRE